LFRGVKDMLAAEIRKELKERVDELLDASQRQVEATRDLVMAANNLALTIDKLRAELAKAV